MNCSKCDKTVTIIESLLEEEVNNATSTSKVRRGFCFHCGTVFRPNIKKFTLTIHRRLAGGGLGSFCLLESGDTFSEMWVLVPTYRELFRSDSENNAYILRISGLKEEYFDENNQPRGRYLSVYEELIDKNTVVEKEYSNTLN